MILNFFFKDSITWISLYQTFHGSHEKEDSAIDVSNQRDKLDDSDNYDGPEGEDFYLQQSKKACIIRSVLKYSRNAKEAVVELMVVVTVVVTVILTPIFPQSSLLIFLITGAESCLNGLLSI